VFSVNDIITLNTDGLQGKPFDWRQYGGPLALLRLSHFVRREILKDNSPPRRVIPMPKDVYYQQGNLILKRTSGGNDENEAG
jgi:hypothetical protein